VVALVNRLYHSIPKPSPLVPLLAACLGAGFVLPLRAAEPLPEVVDVPSRPAYVRPPGAAEQPARRGQRLATKTLVRTRKPGRLQVRLPDGRSFRLGGDSLLEIGPKGIDLLRGQIIAWVNPGQKGSSPLQIRTRVATASITGTTVFIESSTEKVSFFSWEGTVEVDTDQGKRFTLRSGDQMAKVGNTWQLPRPLPMVERTQRRRRSPLLNGFTAPMETLPTLEKELGLRP
jgi:hypothetical protein